MSDIRSLRKGMDLKSFFLRLANCKNTALLLDYDGTLTPFQNNPKEALSYPGVRRRLEVILKKGRTRLTIISGRSIQDLLPLLNINPTPEIWGSHGREQLTPENEYYLEIVGPASRQGLHKAEEWAENRSLEGWIENKPGCLALHFRGRDPRQVRQIAKLAKCSWNGIAEEFQLELHDFDGGMELRVPGQNKGDAVRSVLSEMGVGAGIAYLGDDLTDEDAFKALQGKGLSVLVRPEFRETEADLWIRPPAELRQFLDGWIEFSNRDSK